MVVAAVAVAVDMAEATFETGIATFEIEIETATFETTAMVPHFDGTWIAIGIAGTEILTPETTVVASVEVAHDPQRATFAT
jgi:hypothetical protein